VVSFCAYIELKWLHFLCKLLLLYGSASQSSSYGLLPVSEHSCHRQTDFDVLLLFCYVVASPAQFGHLVGIVMGLRAGRPRNHCLIPGRGQKFFSSPQYPDLFWWPRNSYSTDTLPACETPLSPSWQLTSI